jgi:hypothetical protein
LETTESWRSEILVYICPSGTTWPPRYLILGSFNVFQIRAV